MGGGPANEGWACHVGLTAGEGVAADNVVPRWSAPGAAALRRPRPARPQPARRGCLAGRAMFSRKKRELMKTPSISKKNRAGSPSPQPSGVSEPRGGGTGGGLAATGARAPLWHRAGAWRQHAEPAAAGCPGQLQPLPGGAAGARQR